MDLQVNALDQGSSARWVGYTVLIVLYLAVGYGVSRGLDMGDRFRTGMPWFAPPPATFAAVWPVLYLLAGYSVCRVVQKAVAQRPAWGQGGAWVYWVALLAAALHLALSNTWLAVFAKGQIRNSCFVLLGLVLAVALQLYASAAIDKVSGFVLVPVLVWLGYAMLMGIGYGNSQVEVQDPAART